jgi:hypothetical protein
VPGLTELSATEKRGERIRVTDRRERLATCRSIRENDIGVIILVNAEKALQCRFVTDAAGELKAANRSVTATWGYSARDLIQLLDPERFHVFSTSDEG